MLVVLTGQLIVSIALVGHDAPIAIPMESAFDSDLYGWPSNTSDEISWNDGAGADPGNLGGCIRFADVTEASAYSSAPAKFLGDWSALDGMGSLASDHDIVQFGDGDVLSPYRIEVSGHTADQPA